MTAEQENLLRRHYADTRTDRLAAALGVSYRTVCRWAAGLGLKKHEDFRQSFSAINGSMERNWSHHPKGEGAKLSAEVTEYLRRHYATTDNRVLADHFHVNDRTIRRWADKLALRKDSDKYAPCRQTRHDARTAVPVSGHYPRTLPRRPARRGTCKAYRLLFRLYSDNSQSI